MSIVYPENRKEVVDRVSTDVQNELPELTPQLRNSLIRALIIGFSGRLFDLYTQQQQAQIELFPDTATILEFIRRWGLLKGIDVNPAARSTGRITASGTFGSIIPEGTIYNNAAGLEYETINQDYTITSPIYSVTSLTRNLSIATAILSVDHVLASGSTVTVSGANESEYNVAAVVTVTGENSFSYQITGTPATPATGTITATADIANVQVQSIETGKTQNLDSGAQLTLETPIAGVDDDAFVQFGNISGGTDEESNEDYRARILDAYANPISNSNDSDVIRVSKSVPGVTRVWVFDANPQAGEFKTYFVRDNDDNIIPDANEIATVKDKILEIKPAPMSDDDVHVLAPIPVEVVFQFTSLVPDSQTMRSEIEKSLEQMFSETPQVSVNLQKNSYLCAINDTLNLETGEKVESFTLSMPTGDIAVGDGGLAVLKSIAYV